MSRSRLRFRRFAVRLARDERGVEIIQFAIVLPVLIILGLMGAEVVHYVLAVMRVNQIAMTTADNAGRVRISIDEADINELMVGAKFIGDGIDFAENGRIILSDLEQRTNTSGTGGQGTKTSDNPNGYRQWIRWQRCTGALNVASSYGTPLDASNNPVIDLDNTTNADHGAVENRSIIDGMGLSASQAAASSGTAVMFVEVVYNYQPIVPINFLGARQITTTSAFNVRQRTDYPIYNADALKTNKRSDCRLFSATVPIIS